MDHFPPFGLSEKGYLYLLNRPYEMRYAITKRKLRPRQPYYLMRGKRKDGRWVKEWNLMVPDEILNQSWAEVL